MANVRDMGSPAKLGTKSITVNGTYNASSDDLDGFSQVSVNVPSATLGTKSITENGTYNASSDNLDGYSQVNVNVPEAVLGTKSITENGTYNASSDNLDGYSQVSVNVPASVNKLIPYKSRLYSGWYINSSGLFKNDPSDPACVVISFPVENGHTYAIMSGTGTNIDRQRFGYSQNDLIDNPIQEQLSNYFTAGNIGTYLSRYQVISPAPFDGYLIGYIHNVSPDNGVICYLLDVTGVDMDGSIS